MSNCAIVWASFRVLLQGEGVYLLAVLKFTLNCTEIQNFDDVMSDPLFAGVYCSESFHMESTSPIKGSQKKKKKKKKKFGLLEISHCMRGSFLVV